MTFNTITVSPGVELSYIDSGAPPNASKYTTIFALHGMVFTNLVFQKLQAIAPTKGVRLVAPNRRAWPGSTEYSTEELEITSNGGTAEQKDAQLRARGNEIALFIDAFITKFDLPPISDDAASGGVIILGWSIAAYLAIAAISSSHTLPEDVRSRLALHVRSLILYEPATLPLGLPVPEQNYSPLADTTIPPHHRLRDFGQWVSSYFDHKDLSNKDPNSLSWMTPSPDRIPTLFTIPAHLKDEMISDGVGANVDVPPLIHWQEQLLASYRKALYDPETIKAFPRMKITLLAGDKTVAFGIQALWAVQNDEKEIGGGKAINYKIVAGINHFWHWEEPHEALNGFLSCS